MLETGIFLLFAAGLLACVLTGLSVLYALVFGFFLFFGYGLWKKHPVGEMCRMAFSGVRTVKNVLVTMALIGIVTAVWRASGTIAYIVYHATGLCLPSVMLVMTFLLCCLISFLTGTAFGTAATVGVICMTLANSMGIPAAWTGGAVLAGSFFGDRCSPMSTSALLVSEITGTSLFRNLPVMMKTAAVPLGLSCAAYLVLGFLCGGASDAAGVRDIFRECYRLAPFTVLPVVTILVLSALKINVKITLGISAFFGALAAVFWQGMSLPELFRTAVLGFHPASEELAALMSGGGVVSMLKVIEIVCLSSCYAGMFDGTGFLNSIRRQMKKLGEAATPFGAVLLTAAVSSVIACNQTLAIMLTRQICDSIVPDKETMASYLEDTAVVVPALVPWSIAAAVPLETVGAPVTAILFAFYLYLIPLWNLAVSLKHGRKTAGDSV